MKIVDRFPRRITRIDPMWIPLADGCRLAARVWLPEDALRDRVPAILEYLPYRRRDGTALRDEEMHAYTAGHGYACVRVDMRGTGDSDGVFLDEYLPQEQTDAVEIVAWLARQPWCSGAVGMMGISWGGFNALQVAALRPPALKAIITACSTDDRYADDTHYMGGCLLLGNLTWAAAMFAFCSRPPDPAIVGERWKTMWLERLEKIPLLADVWTGHQRRDAYWEQGSVCLDFAAIACPVFAVGGWADAYTNAIPRLLAGLKAPRLGLIGPWAHGWPHSARPGPAIGFLQEALRWWDHWLKGRQNGVMEQPMLRAWMQESVSPATFYEIRPGRWVSEPCWPSPAIRPRHWNLTTAGLSDAPGEGRMVLRSPQSVGAVSGAWCPYGLEGDLPADQHIDDERSLIFETPPLAQPMEVLGAPEVRLRIASDCSNAFLAARISDVARDGAATRVTYGLLNLTHRESHRDPTPLQPGRMYEVRLRLNDFGHAFPPGHRIRLALSNAYFPLVWPSPAPATLTLDLAGSALSLPERAPRPADADLPAFAGPETANPLAHALLRPGSRQREVRFDPVTAETKIVARKDRGAVRFAGIDLETDLGGEETYTVRDNDPLSARAETAWTVNLRRGAWHVRTLTKTALTASAEAFHLDASLEAFDGKTRVFAKAWRKTIRRDLV
jgi:uncharacterized protein